MKNSQGAKRKNSSSGLEACWTGCRPTKPSKHLSSAMSIVPTDQPALHSLQAFPGQS